MNHLLLFTNDYPLNFGDSAFISREIPYIAKEFDAVTILCMTDLEEKKDCLNVPDNVTVVYFSDISYKKRKYGIHFSVLCQSFFYRELYLIVKKRVNIIKKINYARTFLYTSLCIQKIIDSNKLIFDNSTLYSYWYRNEPLAAILLKKKYPGIKILTRTHGYDLYEFQNPLSYQAYKDYMDRHMDKIIFVSQQGFEYYQKTFAVSKKEKYEIHKLGITNNAKPQLDVNKTVLLRLVSCAYMVSLKRIHFIIEALAALSIPVEWIHIGSGEIENQLRELAQQKLGVKKNITYKFLGSLTNTQVMEHYAANYYDCFISTTETEGGCPVSMQECMSFGIPVIATAVGGIPEIVNETNGILVYEPCSSSDFAQALQHFVESTREQKESMRKNAYATWQTKFNADKNFYEFSQSVKKLSMRT